MSGVGMILQKSRSAKLPMDAATAQAIFLSMCSALSTINCHLDHQDDAAMVFFSGELFLSAISH
jgi:hypothetical protein